MPEIKNKQQENIDFGRALSERYLAYSLSTIMSRSLPNVRDGLKPVHRRLLYAMLQLYLSPESGYKKCARIVGDVIGKYHPHGEVAVYDTLVRLAQSFSVRYPLIEGQGNFGSIDGDNAASMRYTESKMTKIAMLLMADIDKDTVNFKPTYDNSESEPLIFPAVFPNILANGAEGIAVGMATSIPPHNLHELCEALIYLIDNPEANTNDLMEFISGPDLPTGGVIIDSKETILKNYALGKGNFRIRAKWFKEDLGYGTYQIVITEIPYQVQKSKLIEHLADLLKDKKLPLVADIRDESAEDVRVIIEPKSKNYSADIVMESLFKLSSLESRISLNMNVIDSANIPRIMNISEILTEFLIHRQDIITRRTIFQVNKILIKTEILEGLKIAYLNLDEVIQIIRLEDEPKEIMMHRFNLSNNQVEAILNTKLRSLRKLEEQEIINELYDLNIKLQELQNILNEPKILWSVIKNEVKHIKAQFNKTTPLGARRTEFIEVEEKRDIDISAFIEKEPITILCSKMGWLKTIKGHNNDLQTIKYKEGDEQQFVVQGYTTDKIIVCAANGKFFTILANNISKGKGEGESIRLTIDIENSQIVNIFTYNPIEKILIASSTGRGFIVKAEEVISSTRLGKQVMILNKDEACIKCFIIDKEYIATIGQNRKLLIFNSSEIPELRRGRGVILQRFKDAKLTDIKIFNKEEGLVFTNNGKTRLEKDISSWLGKRGGVGKIPPIGFAKNNIF